MLHPWILSGAESSHRVLSLKSPYSSGLLGTGKSSLGTISGKETFMGPPCVPITILKRKWSNIFWTLSLLQTNYGRRLASVSKNIAEGPKILSTPFVIGTRTLIKAIFSTNYGDWFSASSSGQSGKKGTSAYSKIKALLINNLEQVFSQS